MPVWRCLVPVYRLLITAYAALTRMKDYYPTLSPGVVYHIFNRGNNRETIFFTDANYQYFLGKYAKYLSPVLDTYAYCLLPNHFHLVARVKTPEETAAVPDFPGFKNLESLARDAVPDPDDNPDPDDRIGRLVSNQFRLCFMSYAKALNKQRRRTGSLFQKNFKRLAVHSEGYFTNLILYVHANPQLHGIWDDYRDWPHSSYASLLSDGVTRLQREAVLNWFSSKEAFVGAHRQYLDLKMVENLMIED